MYGIRREGNQKSGLKVGQIPDTQWIDDMKLFSSMIYNQEPHYQPDVRF